MRKQSSLDISIADARWNKIPKLATYLEKTAQLTLSELPQQFRFPCTATLLLTSDAAVRCFNRDFRGIDKPTNVLSFPQFTPKQLAKMGKNTAPMPIGDIVFAYQYMVDEAKRDHKVLINHAIHLLIHGLLHLFGYDHQSNKEANNMERLEKRIMAKLGLPDPYQLIANKPNTPRTKKPKRKP